MSSQGCSIISPVSTRVGASELVIQLRKEGWDYDEPFHAVVDPDSHDEMRQVILDAMARHGYDERWAADFDAEIRWAQDPVHPWHFSPSTGVH